MSRFLYLLLLLLGSTTLNCLAETNSLPPLPPSPVQPFRQWLEMSPADRDKALAEYSAPKRAILKRKLLDYDQLTPAERERRLQMLEIRYYIRPLMTNSLDERSSRVESLPLPLQKVLSQRLRQWDTLPPEIRHKILTNETAVNYFAALPPMPPGAVIASGNQEGTAGAALDLQVWPSLPDAERARMTARFDQYFQWPKEDQARILETLSENERQEMQNTLDAFSRLSPEQRRVCINSFTRLTQMSPQERNLFLKNAARWSAMTPEERKTWKSLVTELPPLPQIAPPLPPTPKPAAPPQP
jgi:hypothetical protein